jgi:hypothetical protein
LTGAKISRLLICLALISALIACAVFIYSFVSVFIDSRISFKTVLKSALLLILLLALVMLIARAFRRKEALLLPFVLLITLFVRGAFILYFNTQPDSDFSTLYLAAQSLLRGDRAWLFSRYFSLWSYQIPFVAFEALILKLFGTMAALKIVNLLCMLGISFFIYKIALLFASRASAFSMTLLYALCPEAVFLSSVLTNQHLSLLLLLSGLYFALCKRGSVFPLIGGALISLGNLIRPEGILVVAALIFVYIVLLIKNTAGRSSVFLNFFLLSASYLALHFLSCLAFKAAGLAPLGLNSACPEWKFILGLDPAQKGSYNETHTAILSISDSAARKAETIRIIRGSFTNYESFYGAFPDSFWAFAGLRVENRTFLGLPFQQAIYEVSVFDRVLFAFVSSFSGFAFALSFKSKAEPPKMLLFCAALICLFFAVYLFIEIQPRYRYFISPFLFIPSAYTLDSFKRRFLKS